METAPLKSFATWARRELITQVSARLTAVLAPSSPERVENQRAVAMLERDIAAAGGGAKGKDVIVDKVAYTWFNRIIALRFMDANGYTGIGVVSPAHGQQVGQPEMLADAKRGSIDPAVITSKRTLDAITGLLDGTRPSADAQGEAYTLLLAEYCRYWNRSMPFMFEREGDYTELLIPANLLAADSILTRATAALTEGVCREVEVIGWLYQFYISERKDEVFAGFKKGKKAGAAEIPAATQLFTPHWIVRYLVENSVGRLWMLNHPDSRLVDRMDYYIAPVDEETDFLRIAGPEELTVIDPACGSGHMLTYAFDLLYAIYAEEGYAPSEIPELILTHNLYGTEIDPRAGALAAFALTMKARAKQRAFFVKHTRPNICVVEPVSFSTDDIRFLATPGRDFRAGTEFWNQFEHATTLGSLIQPRARDTASAVAALEKLDASGDLLYQDAIERAHKVARQAQVLSGSYSVVVANPPYMGSKNMDGRLASYAKDVFPNTKSDLFAMFIERCLAFTAPHGSTAMITMQSWMFISSYEKLRNRVIQANPASSMLHLGERAFDSISGSVVSTTAFVLEPGGDPRRAASYIRAVEGENEAAKRALVLNAAKEIDAESTFVVVSRDFSRIPGQPIAYWLTDAMRGAFSVGEPLREAAEPKVGLQTSNVDRFVRLWTEVSSSDLATGCHSREEGMQSGSKWFPYNNGGDFRKWYGNQDDVVNWQDDGVEVRSYGMDAGGRPRSRPQNQEVYFREAVAWTAVSSGVPGFRFFPKGFIPSNAGMACYADAKVLDDLLGIVNSSVAERLLSAMAPTLNLGVGEIGRLPVTSAREPLEHRRVVRELVSGSRDDWDSYETSWHFGALPLLSAPGVTIADRANVLSNRWAEAAALQQRLEVENNRLVAEAYGLEAEVPTSVPLHRVSLSRNVEFRFGAGKKRDEYLNLERWDLAADLVSYAVGCMFGRYSLDEPGLILADQGATLQDYLARVPQPTFVPDADNVLPIVDGDWFEDDIVARFRQFLRAAFGEEHFEENLRFVEESLGVKSLREYFVTRAGRSKFYDDHVKRYKKRPIYWLFSSPKGSFNALIYMHRYAPSTVSTVLNEYLREFESKLEANLQHQERLAAGDGTPREKATALKEAERLRKVLLELGEYEHDVLYPLASQQIAIDLDDGVKVNYPRFYPALKKITGLEAADE